MLNINSVKTTLPDVDGEVFALESSVLYKLKKGLMVLVPPGKYEGNVYKGNVRFGLIAFNGKINVCLQHESIMEIMSDCELVLSIVPIRIKDEVSVSLPPPPEKLDPVEDLILRILRERGIIAPGEGEIGRDMFMDDEDEDDWFDDNDTGLDTDSLYHLPEEEDIEEPAETLVEPEPEDPVQTAVAGDQPA